MSKLFETLFIMFDYQLKHDDLHTYT